MRKIKYLLNLQYFAEGEAPEGANETEPADQSEVTPEVSETEETGVNEEESAEPQPQSHETNAAFAAMRRELEAQKKAQEALDAQYAAQFGSYTNPETGEPIRTAKDYMEAMAAQEREQTRAKLQENNIDPKLIDQMIASSPIVRQAQEATQELQNFRAQRQLDEDLKKILAIDNRFDSIEALKADPSMQEVAEYCTSHPGVRADEAYKIINYDRLTSSKGAAAKQAAINSVKGKNHLSTGASLDVDSNMEEIPADKIEMYKEAFPGKSLKEIKAIYNKAIALRR